MIYTTICKTVLAVTSLANAAAIPAGDVMPKKLSVRPIAQLSNNNTWLENLVVRSNGDILATRLDTAALMSISPSTGHVSTLATFPNLTATAGITEIAPDVFAVIAGGFDLSTAKATPGSFVIYKVDLNQRSPSDDLRPQVSVLARVPGALNLNGLTFAPPCTLFSSDIYGGAIWSIDVVTGMPKIATNSTLFTSPDPKLPFGVDGVRFDQDDRALFFTSSVQGILGRIPVSEGGVLGTPEKIAINPLNATLSLFDDFARSGCGCGDFYVTTNFGNTIQKISRDGKTQVALVGDRETTQVAGPTSVAFGRRPEDRNVLYAVTSGDLLKPVNGTAVGAQVLAIDLSGM